MKSYTQLAVGTKRPFENTEEEAPITCWTKENSKSHILKTRMSVYVNS